MAERFLIQCEKLKKILRGIDNASLIFCNLEISRQIEVVNHSTLKFDD